MKLSISALSIVIVIAILYLRFYRSPQGRLSYLWVRNSRPPFQFQSRLCQADLSISPTRNVEIWFLRSLSKQLSAIEMAYPLPLRRPWVPLHSFSSNSLSGMEITVPKPLPFPGTLSSSRYPGSDETIEKPLPPTPRKPSSVYSLRDDGTTEGGNKDTQNAVLSPDSILQPTIYRSSTSIVPVISGTRPALLRNQEGHAVSDPIIERRRAQREDLAELGIHSSQLLTQHPILNSPASPVSQTQRLIEMNLQRKDADQHASTYESVLHTRSSIIPSFTSEPYSNYACMPSLMSPRITDVVDQSLVPPPLRYSAVVKDSRSSSHLSSRSSSSTEFFQSSVRDSLRAYARKTFHLRKPPMTGKRKRALENTDPLNLAALSSRRRSSASGQRRGSIQQGLSHMYSSLRKLSVTSSSPKATGNPKKGRLPRELRSPAIPITPYQQIGTKAWERPSKSRKHSRPGSATSTHLLFSSREHKDSSRYNHHSGNQAPKPTSIVNKITTAFHNGTVQVESAIGLNTERSKRSKAELRREELKRKIVVLGLGEQPMRNGD